MGMHPTATGRIALTPVDVAAARILPQCLCRSSPRREPACLSRTQESARPHASVWRLAGDRVELDQNKGAQLPPSCPTLLSPDPQDPASTTQALDELRSCVPKKAHDSRMWMALCLSWLLGLSVLG